jgi:hypothetical protein
LVEIPIAHEEATVIRFNSLFAHGLTMAAQEIAEKHRKIVWNYGGTHRGYPGLRFVFR